MATANQIIRSALGKLGIVSPGESVKPGDAEDCLRALNVVLDAWRVEHLYAYATQDVTYTPPAPAQQVTIGPAGDIAAAARPERFEAGCYVSFGGSDRPLAQVTEAEYNDIELKAAGDGPCVFTYNAALPLGVLRLYPRAPAGATLHLMVQVQLTAFANLTTNYALPAGYERALIYTLAEEVGADFEREIPPTVARNAANARRFIKRMNQTVPQLAVGHEDRFNILTG